MPIPGRRVAPTAATRASVATSLGPGSSAVGGHGGFSADAPLSRATNEVPSRIRERARSMHQNEPLYVVS